MGWEVGSRSRSKIPVAIASFTCITSTASFTCITSTHLHVLLLRIYMLDRLKGR